MIKQEYPKIVFVGAHVEAELPLAHLITMGENLAGLFTLEPQALSRMSGGVDLSLIATAAGIPVRKGENVNGPESVEWIRAIAPDLMLVIGWTQLLQPELLNVPRIACLGFHASLLPKYRGRAPVNWAIINGEKETGNTMIVLEPGADEGDIVAQRVIPIEDDDDCGTVYQKVSLSECDMLSDVLPLIRQDGMPRQKQNSLEATVMPKRRPEDGLIDWSHPSRRLYNWIRALTTPYPGAFSHSNGRRITIWRAALGTLTSPSPNLPGTVLLDVDGFPIVATRDGYIKLIRVAREGEKAITGIEAGMSYLKPPALLGAGRLEQVR